jgi:hypothetical protein
MYVLLSKKKTYVRTIQSQEKGFLAVEIRHVTHV